MPINIFRAGVATRKCYPVVDILRPASELNFKQIRNSWYYKSSNNPEIRINASPRNDSVILHVNDVPPTYNHSRRIGIITLEEWLDVFVGTSPRSRYYNLLQLLWLDVKVPADR